MSIQSLTTYSLSNNGISGTFSALMEHAIATDSMYMQALDKIEEVGTDEQFTISEKAKLIAKLAVNMVPGITKTAMSVSFSSAKADRDALYDYPASVASGYLMEAGALKAKAEAVAEEKNYEAALLRTEAAELNADSAEIGATIAHNKAYTILDNNMTVVQKEMELEGRAANVSIDNAEIAGTNASTGVLGAAIAAYNAKTSKEGTLSQARYTFGKIARDADLKDAQRAVQERTIYSYCDNRLQHTANALSQYITTAIGVGAYSQADKYFCAWMDTTERLRQPTLCTKSGL